MSLTAWKGTSSLQAIYTTDRINYFQDGNRFKFEHDNPFLDEDEEDEVAPVGYRYRKWCLGNDINLVARTEHDSVQAAPNSEMQYINIKVKTCSSAGMFNFVVFPVLKTFI